MILVIGPSASGKHQYVLSLGYDESDISDGVLSDKPVLINLQDLIVKDPDISKCILNDLLSKDVVCCDEVGGGIVPIDPELRILRDIIGRLCCDLAKEASQVVRMVCGIPVQIKPLDDSDQ